MNVIIPPTPPTPPTPPRQGLCSQGNAEDKRRSGCLLCVCGRMCRCVGEHSSSVALAVMCKASERYHPTHPPNPPPQTPHPRQGLCSQGNAEDKRRSGCLLCVCGRMCRCVGEHSSSVASPVMCKANERYHPTHPPNPPPTPGKVYVHKEMQKIRGDQGVFFVCVDVCADV